MKADVHPKYFSQAQVICSCGNRFTTGSTVDIIHVELCSKCHPFFTGDQRFIDQRSVIKDFEHKRKVAKQYQARRAEKVEKQKKQETEPKTLREMLLGAN